MQSGSNDYGREPELGRPLDLGAGACPPREKWSQKPLERAHKRKGPIHRNGIGPSSCPSWARTRTLLIQRGRCNGPNSDNLPQFTRVRVTRCWNSRLPCRNLPHFTHSNVGVCWDSTSRTGRKPPKQAAPPRSTSRYKRPTDRTAIFS